jgi:Zn-dependent membrane protease YugP
MIFDPLYFLMLAPAMLLAVYAQWKLKATYAKTSQIPAASGLSGAEAARRILNQAGLSNVTVERIESALGDHYDPSKKVLRLSPDVFSGRSLASLGIAAHEAGHAIQDAQRYPLLVVRNAVVPMASFGSNLSWILLFGGMAISSMQLIMLGIALFGVVVFFQIVNLPVEFDASARAKRVLAESGMVQPQERQAVAGVLSAAAMTYVAATLTSILTLVYYLMRSGLLGGSSDER